MQPQLLSQLVERAVGAATPRDLSTTLQKLERELHRGGDSSEAKSSALEHALRRLILSAASASQPVQKAALTIFLYLLRTRNDILPDALVQLVVAETAEDKTVTKGEKKYFIFARIVLSFLLLNETCASPEPLLDVIEQGAQKDLFSLRVIGGMFSEFGCSERNTPLLARLLGLAVGNTFHCFDFLLSAEQALFQHTQNEASGTKRRELVDLLRELTRNARRFFAPKAFFFALESVQNDPHFAGRPEQLSIARKAAQFITRNKDIRGKLFAPLLAAFCDAWEGKGRPGRAATSLFLDFSAEMAAQSSCDNAAWLLCQRLWKIGESAPLLRKKTGEIRRNIFLSIARERNTDAAEFFAHGFAEKGLGENRLWQGLLDLIGAESIKALLRKVTARLSSSTSVAEAVQAVDCLAQLAIAAKGETREEALQRIASVHKGAADTISGFAEDLKESSHTALVRELQAAVRQRILHKLLSALDFEGLLFLAQCWASAEDGVATECLAVAPQLVEARQADLARCLLVCLFRIESEDEIQDRETLLFSQVIDDLLAFSENLVSDAAEISAADLHIFTDSLLCLLGVENAALRGWINRTFLGFAPRLDEECVQMLEEAFFDEGPKNPLGETDDELSDIELPGKLI